MRYSKEREAILNYINEEKTHPTALKVYEDLKTTYPSLSLGTVYRNLNQLVDAGLLIRINMGDDHDRFDASTFNHFHAFCLKCESIRDIMNLETELDEKIYKGIGFKVVSHSLLFKGFCKNCLKEELENGTKRK